MTFRLKSAHAHIRQIRVSCYIRIIYTSTSSPAIALIGRIFSHAHHHKNGDEHGDSNVT